MSERTTEVKRGAGAKPPVGGACIPLSKSKTLNSIPPMDLPSFPSSSLNNLNGLSSVNHQISLDKSGLRNSGEFPAETYFSSNRPSSAVTSQTPGVLSSSSLNLFDIYKPTSSSSRFNTIPPLCSDGLNNPFISPANLLNTSNMYSPTDSTPSCSNNGLISSSSHQFENSNKLSYSLNNSPLDSSPDDETLRKIR